MKFDPEEIEAIAAAFARHIAPVQPETNPDPLLSVGKTARRMGISETAVRRLIKDGYLPTVPGLDELRVKQSVADNYGKPKARK